jgi:hypothetical protein
MPADIPTHLPAPYVIEVRAPDQIEHRFRGKPNTHSGGSRTPIPGRPNVLSG